YLDAKSVQSLATPSSLNDLEALLNSPLINKGTEMINGSTDEYYYYYNDWLSRTDVFKKDYVWDAQLNDYDDWRDEFKAAFYANTILFNLPNISSNGDGARWNNIKGSALFYRALAFYR